MSAWSDHTIDQFVKSMKERRTHLAKSLQDIAETTELLGHPINRSTLSNYETGRSRKIALPDALIIAAALDTSLALMLYPNMPDGEVEWLPVEKWNAWDAGRSLLGIDPPGYYGDRLREAMVDYIRAAETLELVVGRSASDNGTALARLSYQLVELRGEKARLASEQNARGGEPTDEWREQYAQVERDIEAMTLAIRNFGGVVDDG